MKIATYNIWNENKGVGDRCRLIMDEILRVGADVIALQEITPDFYGNFLSPLPEYPFSRFGKYSGEEEGLAVLSKYPIDDSTFLHEDESYSNACALNVIISADGLKISLTDVHFPWDSIIAKEEQIVSVNRFCRNQLESRLADYLEVIGEIKFVIKSIPHLYKTGQHTLSGQEAKPYWYEVSSVYAAIHGHELQPTLDCVNTPRWKGKPATYAPENFDRIYVLNVRNGYRFESVEVFGTEVEPATGLCPSDHYGVSAEIKFLR